MTVPVQLSSAERVDHLLNRIGELDPQLHSVIAVNAAAMTTAIERDAERRDGRVRSPLHGTPVLVKDNIDTVDMETTAGSLALVGCPPASDAPLVTRLRHAGLVVLGKTNLSEWANIRSLHSTSGWSAVGGLTGNPWGAGRSAGGSSSGSGAAVAAGLAPFAVGTETDGSIVCPAALTGVVGVKPTVGLVPGAGIVPISSSQDSAGPMARSVHDAAALLDVLADSADRYVAATTSGTGRDTLRGVRLGVARTWFTEHPATDAVAESVLSQLSAAGAVLVDPVDVAPELSGPAGEEELVVLLHELARDLQTYLAARPPGAPRSLADVVTFNRARADVELAWFGQDLFEQALSEQMRDEVAYRAARERVLDVAKRGLDGALSGQQLDGIVAPAYGPAWLSDLINGDGIGGGKATSAPAVAGYPILSIPMGFVHGLPVGLALVGAAHAEETLLRVATGIESVIGLHAAGALHPPGW